jgi:GTP-binding protein YchF
MRVALIGLPAAGKKTLFTLLTGRAVPAGRKPGEIVEGVARIQDPRVDRLSAICDPRKTVYAENLFVLCPDAPLRGENREWLEAVARCELICLVLRAFESEAVFHPSGSVDPARDRSFLESELLLADLEIVEKRLTRIAKEARNRLGPDQALEEKALHKCQQALEAGRRLEDAALNAHELRSIRSLGLRTLIPLLCAYNVSESHLRHDFGPRSLAVSALIEAEIAGIESAAERAEYVASLGLASSGLDRMNAAAYDALGLMSFYTIGKDEVRAWTIRKGSTAPTAGGKVHTDIERGFVRAEVIKYDDLVAAGSEKAARDSGKMQLRGKDYVIEDGDICHFLFSV